jgi:hypothetical protein
MFSTDYRANAAVIVRERKFMSVIGQVNFSQVIQVWAQSPTLLSTPPSTSLAYNGRTA